MGLRFRRRVKVAPGVYLNIGKNGVSTTIGPKGANINIGKGGVYVNAGIPGTGISYREKLFGNPNHPDVSDDNKLQLTTNGPSFFDEGKTTTSHGLIDIKEHIETSRKEINEIKDEIERVNQELLDRSDKIYDKENKFFSKLFTSKTELENLKIEFEDLQSYRKELGNQLNESKLDINNLLDDHTAELYEEVVKSFKTLSKSKKIWDITSQVRNSDAKSSASTTVERDEVEFETMSIDYINSDFPVLHMFNANGVQLYIYPAFTMTVDINGKIELIDNKDLVFDFSPKRFMENIEDIPADSKIIDQTWLKVNKDGTPDKRFAGNYQIPVVRYGKLVIKSPNGLDECFYISNYEAAEDFNNKLKTYLAAALKINDTNDKRVSTISVEEFTRVKEYADKHVDIFEKIKSDKALCSSVVKIPELEVTKIGESELILKYLFILDLFKCFSLLKNLDNVNNKESVALLHIVGRLEGMELDIEYLDKEIYYDKILSLYNNYLNIIRRDLESPVTDNEMFRLSVILSRLDKDLQERYLSSIYRIASVVVKMDGKVSAEEEAVLKRILQLNSNYKTEKGYNRQIEHTINPSENNISLEEILNELNSLIGLQEVKNQVKTLINFIKVQKTREEKGFKSTSISYHIVFTGNPGTGKTTVARLIAKIYKSLGILINGHLVETDRSGLVAEYQGQTAVKTNKLVDSALNGVLFLDEAYSIVSDEKDSFGKEAVSTLIKRIEDDRDKLVVILAGYNNEINQFIDTNPGFKSRFNRYIEFPDYTPDELMEIFLSLCSKNDYKISDSAKNKLKDLIDVDYSAKDKHFGNARYVRNLFEKTMENQANRIAGIGKLTDEILVTIVEEDLQ